MITRSWTAVVAGGLLSFVLGASARAQSSPSYTFEYLGPGVGVSGLNDAGELVGTGSFGLNLGAWVARSGSPIAPLPLPPGRISSSASGINDLGVVVGAVGSYYSPEFFGVAAAWYPDGSGGYTVVELGVLPGHVRSLAAAVNNLGDIVGYSSDGTYRYPVLFTAPGGPQDLSSTGIFDPSAINDQRVLVDSSFTTRRMDLDTMIVEDLGVPTGLPTNYMATRAAAINSSNQVAGLAIIATSTDCDRQAARYTDGIGWEIFSPCGYSNGAYDLNDRGDLVMRWNVAPYVYLDGLGTYLIEDLIENTVGHWYVINSFGLGINDARQLAIAAHNTTTGESGILLLTPIGPVGTSHCFGDGSGSACPCGNEGADMAGCTNGSGAGCGLDGSGSASVAAGDLALHAWNALPSQPGLFFQGDSLIAGGAGVAFGDGLRCAVVNVVRLEVVVPGAGGAASSSVDIAAVGGVAPGDLRHYQYWYRDPSGSPCGTGFNLSNAFSVTWAP